MKKTPVEELFKLLWDTPKDKLTWYAIRKQMMDKEQNVIIDAHIEGQRVFDDYPHTQWTTDQAELYYEKTFKLTKGK
jgi:hypothetical protein